MRNKELQAKLEEFREKGTVLICGTDAKTETFEKMLLSEGLEHYEKKFENGCTRFLKSNTPAY
ncbi:hypothetical protein CN689_14325 [Peribacillus butanolivorans]|uniref:Uncharacterized protein n=1 Tax=Peribacillus butanolivorans TaxID=421767 RepID=A0AAX0S4A9_9BACI|nr:hypothetical protein [Peribacillus butanolivorans]PEJ32301.1 hypothetical protein CN689_14325 [Peribacillus butanolivorans]